MSLSSSAAVKSDSFGPEGGPDRTLDQRGIDQPVRQEIRQIAKGAVDPPPLTTDLAQTWLTWQCRMVAGIIRGALYQPVKGGTIGNILSIWPGEGEGQSQLHEAAARVLAEQRGVIHSQQHYGPKDLRVCDIVACPLQLDGETLAIIAVMISTRAEAQQRAVLQLLQWGGLWMETLIRHRSAAQQEAGIFSQELMAGVIGQPSARGAAMEAANRFADRLTCERVSIGLREGLPIRLWALSHVAGFDTRAQLVRRIEAAMEEAVDQGASLVLSSAAESRLSVTRAHDELLEHHGNGAVCTLPLPGRQGTIGAITLEREASQPFEPDMVEWLESIVRIIGPVLESKQREDRSAWSKGADAIAELAVTVFGRAYLKLKLALLGLVAVLASLAMLQGDYRVTAPASIEGAVRQILVAPQDGYVNQSEVRAGDLVKKGQLIAQLDDRNLQLTRQKWESERNKIEKEYQDALAKRDRTELSVLRAQVDQVDAELRLVDEMIGRNRIEAPFDGVVVSGDLSQSLGAPVETGQTLFEVAPLDSYRVVLEVDEHDVAGLKPGSQGRLIVTALPDSSFAIRVDQVLPVAESSDGSNYFKVEASLIEPSPLLRPGMRGVGKVEMGERDLLWIWTHELVDRLRLWFWALGF